MLFKNVNNLPVLSVNVDLNFNLLEPSSLLRDNLEGFCLTTRYWNAGVPSSLPSIEDC